MRSLKELFIVLRDNEKYFEGGLCGLTHRLFYCGLITTMEYRKLRHYIKWHRPWFWSKHYDKNQRKSRWYWPAGEWEPRLKWINAQIKKLK